MLEGQEILIKLDLSIPRHKKAFKLLDTKGKRKFGNIEDAVTETIIQYFKEESNKQSTEELMIEWVRKAVSEETDRLIQYLEDKNFNLGKEEEKDEKKDEEDTNKNDLQLNDLELADIDWAFLEG